MLGAHLLFQLTAHGHQVKAVYRQGSDRDFTLRTFSYYADDARQQFELIHWVEADLSDIPALSDAMEGVSQVYHCAAIVSFDPADADRMIEVNPQIAANVVNVCLEKGVKKLVHVSSVAALGRQKQGEELDEKSDWVESKQNSAYAKSKYLSELEVWRGMEEGLEAVIVNPSIILGPGHWQHGSAALFGRVANGFKYYTEGVNAYVDVRDIARRMVMLMESDIRQERFVLVAENKSYRELFETIAQKLGVAKPSVHARPWMGEIVWRLELWRARLFGGKPMVTRDTARTAHQVNLYSSKKVRNRLGYEFRSVEDSIEDIAGYYLRDHQR